MSTITYRPFVGHAGEPLLAPLDPEHAAARYSEFVRLTGLDPAQIVTSVTASVPLPLYPDRWPAGRRRWAIDPACMWHPLMWLPDRLAKRVRLTVGGAVQVENDEQWAARVLIEMTAAGLYDEQEGWVDVLALNGLDIDDAAVRDRVVAWCAGAPDPELDAVDLADVIGEPDDPDWAFRAAWGAVHELDPVAWVINADYLLRVIDRYLEAPDALGDERLGHAADSLLALGWLAFSTMPAEMEPDWWKQRRDARPAERRDILEVLLPAARTRLEAIRSAFWDQAMDVVGIGEELAAGLDGA